MIALRNVDRTERGERIERNVFPGAFPYPQIRVLRRMQVADYGDYIAQENR